MKTKIKTRIGTRAESLPFANEIASYGQQKDAQCIELTDGHPKAIRVLFNAVTGEVARNEKGSVTYCAPWLLADLFSIPHRRS